MSKNTFKTIHKLSCFVGHPVYEDEVNVSRTVMMPKTYSVPTKRCETGQEEKCFEFMVPNEEVVSFLISPGVGFFRQLTTF